MRAGEITGSAHERVIVEHVEDAGDRLNDVVFAQFGVTTTAVARPIAATPAFPESAASAAAAPVTVVVLLVRATAVLLSARALLVAAPVGVFLSVLCVSIGLAIFGLGVLLAAVARRLVSGLIGLFIPVVPLTVIARRSPFAGVSAGASSAGASAWLAGASATWLGDSPPAGAPLACPWRLSLIAAISSFLRIPDVPLTPARLANARSSGNTMVDSEPSDALVLASVRPTGCVVVGGSVGGHGVGQLVVFGAVVSRNEVRFSHGFPFFPR